MEFTMLQIGLILLFAAVLGIWAYTESGPRDNKLIAVPGFTLGGAVFGFFAYYIGIALLYIIAFIAAVWVLKLIFSPKVIIVKEDTHISIDK